MKIRDPILLEIMLILYMIFFVALFFMSRWIMDENSVRIEIMIGSVWTTAVSGLLIATLTIRQWKTKRPLPITWIGLSLGLLTLAVSIFSFELLTEIYLHIKIVGLMWLAGLIFLIGFICGGMQLVNLLKRE